MIFAAEDLGDLLDLAVLLSLPGVLVLAWLVGRLLGVRRSWTTTLLSGLIGWIGGVALSLAIASQRKDPDTGFTRNVWLFSTLGVMSASVWIELLAKPGPLARADRTHVDPAPDQGAEAPGPAGQPVRADHPHRHPQRARAVPRPRAP